MNTMHILLRVNNMSKKNKRIIKKSLILFGYVFSILTIIIVCTVINKNPLKKIGYDKNEIRIIKRLSNDEIEIIKKYNYNKNTVKIITDDEYNKDNLNYYLSYSIKYKNYKGIIRYINSYKDELDVNDTVLNILGDKYFINEYLDRYINYYKEHSDLKTSEVVKRINSNLDYTFYVDINSADLSKGMYTLVNKYYFLDSSYVPNDLVQIDTRFARDNTKIVKIVNDAFIALAEAGEKNDIHLFATTGYRDYSFQNSLYNKYVKEDGIDNADRYSARPGFSEHQLGYSIDLSNLDSISFREFEDTKEYKWLKDNAHKYGFIVRYPKDKDYITGYMFEPWHIRYVGIDIATYIYENNITYEEYYAYFIR